MDINMQITECQKLLAAIDRKDTELIIRILKRSQNLELLIKLVPVPFMISNNLLKDRWDQQLLELLSINRNNYAISQYTKSSGLPFIMNLTNKWNRIYNFDIQRFEKYRTLLFEGSGLNKDEFILGEDCVRYIAQTKRSGINSTGLILTLYSLIDTFETGTSVNIYTQKSIDNTVYVLKTDTIVFHIKKHCYDPYSLIYNTDSMLYLHGDIIGTPDAYFLLDYPKQFSFINASAQLQQIRYKSQKYVCQSKTLRFAKTKEIRNCYCCKNFYDTRVCIDLYKEMCIRCGILNYQKLQQSADLSNITAYISGGRIKIGLATVLMLLRNGARVITSTRYPMMAWYNYSKQLDFKQWQDRLEIIKCDFTRMDEITSLISYLRDQKLDLLINNAAQTLQYPQDYFVQCEILEARLSEQVPSIDNVYSRQSTDVITFNTESNIVERPQLSIEKLAKPNPVWSQDQLVLFDRFATLKNISFDQYMDIYQERTISDSTWYKKMEEYSFDELLKVNAINQIVPMMLINKLKPTMSNPSFIINVTAVEGQFTGNKNGNHPHTNACKSALNMIVRTMGLETVAHGKEPSFYIYAIDPGFVSSANPNINEFPITANDAAMRILDPVFQWIKGKPIQSGVKLKDYLPSSW